MRNALFILSVFLFLPIATQTRAASPHATGLDTTSVYAPPLPQQQMSQPPTGIHSYDQQLLPVHGSDLPLANGAGVTGNGESQQISTVEAIPTPTAFHAGAFLLLTIFAVRFIRKLKIC